MPATPTRSTKRSWATPLIKIADIKDLTSNGQGSGADGGTMQGMMMLSDARLKYEIIPCGCADYGLPIYAFRYLSGGPVHVGVMAQDVIEIAPEAVHIDPTGIMAVDYSMLEIDMVVVPV